MSIEKNKENNFDCLIADAKVSCARIKEIDGSIDRLKKRIAEVGQDDPKLAYFEYTCREFEAEKYRLANSFRGSFKEIRTYNQELQENYERLQKIVEVKQITTRYVTRALREDGPNLNWFKKRHTRAVMEEDLQKMRKEKADLALKMEQTSPIVDTIKLLLAEIDEKHPMKTVR